MVGMTRRLKQLLKLVETWREEVQDELADAALEIAQSLEGEYNVTETELAGIDRGIDDARQGRFASDEAVEAVRAKFRSV
jgi:predicted transcriptional regulator